MSGLRLSELLLSVMGHYLNFIIELLNGVSEVRLS